MPSKARVQKMVSGPSLVSGKRISQKSRSFPLIV